jgi:UDP-3-O-[3-hydroxymyristoyl] glucosamine N-acyltransferase
VSARAGWTLGSLAERIGGRLDGDAAVEVFGVRSVEGAREGDLAVVFDRRHASALSGFAGSALILPEDPTIEPPAGRPSLRVSHPRRALVEALHLLHPESRREAGVDPAATVARNARVDSTAFVGPGAVVEEGATVGPRSEVHANSVVGAGVSIGTGTIVFPNVTLYPGVRLGDRVRIHAGTVIGSDGFGFPRGDDGTLSKVPQVGTVVVEDDVEIGANCAIDRATLEETRIGRGTKIDNLVQIGHNSEIGPDCCIMGQVGISGSVRIGAQATLCGQVGIADQVRLAERVVVGAQSGVPHDLTAGVWLGTPAILATRARRVFPALARLPETRQELRELAERVAVLEEILRSGHESD